MKGVGPLYAQTTIPSSFVGTEKREGGEGAGEGTEAPGPSPVELFVRPICCVVSARLEPLAFVIARGALGGRRLLRQHGAASDVRRPGVLLGG